MKKFLLLTTLSLGACAPPVFQDIDMSMYRTPGSFRTVECSAECQYMVDRDNAMHNRYVPFSTSPKTYTITYPGYERSSGIITGKPFIYKTDKTATITVR